jgi:hypothetical protein
VKHCNLLNRQQKFSLSNRLDEEDFSRRELEATIDRGAPKECAEFTCQRQVIGPAQIDGAYLFILLIFFLFSFFLLSQLGLFLLFPFAFIFTSLITHIYFSVIENECSTATTPFYRVD